MLRRGTYPSMFRVPEGLDPTVSALNQRFVFRRFGRVAQATGCGKHRGRLGGVLNERRESKSNVAVLFNAEEKQESKKKRVSSSKEENSGTRDKMGAGFDAMRCPS
jgi:hypothetical protein